MEWGVMWGTILHSLISGKYAQNREIGSTTVVLYGPSNALTVSASSSSTACL